MRKKETVAVQTAQQFLNIESIAGQLIYTRDRYVIGYLSLHGADRKLLDASERESAMRQLSSVLSAEKQSFQLLAVPRTVDVQRMIAKLEAMNESTDAEAMHTLLEGEIAAMQQLMDEGAKEPFLFLKVWERAAPAADRLINRRLDNLTIALQDCSIDSHRLSNAEIKWLCKLYANLTSFVPRNEENADIPFLTGRKRRMTKRIPENETARLLNDMTPCGGFTFKANTLQIGATIGRCYGVTHYPSDVPYGWLVPLMGNLSAVTCITYYPGNAAELGDALSKSIRHSSAGAMQANDARTQKEYLRRVESADRMIDDMDARGKAIGHISIVVMPFTDDEGAFPELCSKTVSLYGGSYLRLKSLGNLQKDAFKHISPYYVNQPRIDHMLKQIIPLDTVCGGEPMTVTLLRDDGGAYFGQSADGSPICVNMLYRGDDRTNGNLMAVGTAGSGKSTAIKHLVQTMYMSGVKILIIDPEREYRDLCKCLGGTWLDAGGGNAKSNPLEIRTAPQDDEQEDNPLFSSGSNAMSMHIKTLLVRLRLQIQSLSDLQLNLLDASLIELYRSFGFEQDAPDVSGRPPESYPTMLDWYKELRELSQTNPRYGELATLLQSMAVGSDAFLWQGHTNVNMDAQLVVIDTNRLLELSKETQASIYFNLLSLCWDVCSRDRRQPTLILADEAHMLFDPRLPEVGMYVRNIAKRARKYESALWIISQSSADFIAENIRFAGQAIVDNSAYRLLFRCDAKNLSDTVDLFSLTDAEAKLISGFERKNALCLIGKQHHIRTIFALPDYKLKMMGEGGGR